ncbi:hypothetical protein MJK72_26730 [Klebsiella pneumoniae]|nr:hypothetical protein MJK72_26730 [Klebsiella pneumoniae]
MKFIASCNPRLMLLNLLYVTNFGIGAEWENILLAGLVGRGFQAIAGGVWVDLFYTKSGCLFLLNYYQRFLRNNLFCGSMR